MAFVMEVWKEMCGETFYGCVSYSPLFSFLVRKSLGNQRCNWRRTKGTKCLRMHKSIDLTSCW